MKALIWGAGAIGGTIGAYLVRSGHDITLVDVVSEHVDAINEQGLTIEGPIDTFTVNIPAFTPDALTGTFHDVSWLTRWWSAGVSEIVIRGSR